MQGQPADPAPRHGRAGRPGRRPVGVRLPAQPGGGPVSAPAPAGGPGAVPPHGSAPDRAEDDTLELPPTADRPPGLPLPAPERAGAELLDAVHRWGPVATPLGGFRLVPVDPDRDLGLLTRWMNDPVTAEFWQLDGPAERTAEHLHAQLAGDGRSVPCLGTLDDRPMSYWEIYRADLDPLARHYPARPHDTGIHLLLGSPEDRGRGTGTALLRAVAELVLRNRPRCGRLIAEPDMRNVRSIAAFHRAGFRTLQESRLPDKRAAIVVRDRDH
ncbi:GNAT family N-acetyltransferase [Streptomyces bohaiensis]|uniref:GNAT family N-acetyltransferase n=1 Tax=Streptomyces bohaiensis TaxID=1431344 RepID=UPI003B76C618